MVVYHGTTADFDTFKLFERRKTKGAGMWFEESNIASTCTGTDRNTGNVTPVFLNAKRRLWSEIAGDISVRKYGKTRGWTVAKIFISDERNRAIGLITLCIQGWL